jgi:hypothetical protein
LRPVGRRPRAERLSAVADPLAGVLHNRDGSIVMIVELHGV